MEKYTKISDDIIEVTTTTQVNVKELLARKQELIDKVTNVEQRIADAKSALCSQVDEQYKPELDGIYAELKDINQHFEGFAENKIDLTHIEDMPVEVPTENTNETTPL